MSYIKNLTINQNYKFLTIPKDIVGKLYLEYKTIDSNFASPIDDQLVLQNVINGETARSFSMIAIAILGMPEQFIIMEPSLK